MNITITGGSGFIGSHLAQQLKENHKVTIIDINPSDIEGVRFIKMDMAHMFQTDKEKLYEVCKTSDVIYHFASSIGVEKIADNPIDTLKASQRINTNFFQSLTFSKAKIIFASTSEVYGSSQNLMKEYDNLQVPSVVNGMRGGYAAQKIAAEFMTATRDNYSIVRFFNVVGPNQNPDIGMVFPRFIDQALNNKDITVFGDGLDYRTYCDIRDAVNVLELLLTEDISVINIGAWNPTSTRGLAEGIIKEINSKSKIVHLKARDEEIKTRRPSLSVMNSIYQEKYNLSDIIQNIVRNIVQNIVQNIPKEY